MVDVATARRSAGDWVLEHATAGVVGAFLTGSAAVGSGDRPLPASSDLDLIIVTAGAAPAKIGKLWHSGVLLDVSSLAVEDLDVATIAGTSYLAPFFSSGMIIYDPRGVLRALQTEVAAIVDQPPWIRRRVAEVRTKITTGLDAADPTAALAAQVLGWVFPASLPTVLLLVAAGRPPTVRKRYLRCRELLTDTRGARLELYENLLGVLGCRAATPEQVRLHLAHVAETLRLTAQYARTTFPFSSDLRPDTWHLVLDGSTELVDAGWHREAVWWLLATYARCALVLAADGPPELAATHERRLADAAAELIGFRSGDGPDRAEEARRVLVEVDALAERLIVAGAE